VDQPAALHTQKGSVAHNKQASGNRNSMAKVAQAAGKQVHKQHRNSQQNLQLIGSH
jgi:hypothetical protein